MIDPESEKGKGPGEVTCREAGRRGGAAVRKKYGKEYFQEIGKRGGSQTAQSRPEGHFQEIGKTGGERTLARYGREHYQALGKKGGKRLAELAAAGRAAEAAQPAPTQEGEADALGPE